MCLSANLTNFFEAGDSAILVEFGAMKLDVFVRARIHAFQVNVQAKSIPGIGVLCPCIRSILVSLKFLVFSLLC